MGRIAARECAITEKHDRGGLSPEAILSGTLWETSSSIASTGRRSRLERGNPRTSPGAQVSSVADRFAVDMAGAIMDRAPEDGHFYSTQERGLMVFELRLWRAGRSGVMPRERRRDVRRDLGIGGKPSQGSHFHSISTTLFCISTSHGDIIQQRRCSSR